MLARFEERLTRAEALAAEAKDTPELAGKFVLPPQDGSHRAFLTAARQMIKEADNHRDALIGHGMPEAMLADLGQALTHYEAASEAANGAKANGSAPPSTSTW